MHWNVNLFSRRTWQAQRRADAYSQRNEGTSTGGQETFSAALLEAQP